MAKRVAARIPDQTAEQVVAWSKRLGLTQSQLMGMAIQAGLAHIIGAISPLDIYTEDQLQKLAKAMGVEIPPEGKNEASVEAGASDGERSPK